MDDLSAWLSLSLISGLSCEKFQRMLEQQNAVTRLFELNESQLKSFELTPNQIEHFLQPDLQQVEMMQQWLQAPEHNLISWLDDRYPVSLKTIDNPPKLLFTKGDIDYLSQPQIAMVGSRSPSAAGRQTAEDFAKHLSSNGLTITSGLARGIDGASHQGALQGIGSTIAVVATGLDRVYPAQHRALAHQISEQGLIITEQPLGMAPHAGLFPLRNRIISGLSLGVLVVEAAIKSGTLITARHAIEQNKDVFAIPGSIHNPAVKGCHALIKQGAKLVETADDIIEELQILVKSDNSGDTTRKIQDKNEHQLDPDYQKLLNCMGYDPIDVDTLISCTGFTAAAIASMLLILELQGDIVAQNGLYTRLGERD